MVLVPDVSSSGEKLKIITKNGHHVFLSLEYGGRTLKHGFRKKYDLLHKR